MTVAEPTYCSREDVQRAPDFKNSLLTNAIVDRALQSASRDIEGHLHRIFYPYDTTFKWDWPNFQYAYPWRLWFDQWDLVSATQVQSPNGTVIPLGNVIFRPVNRKPGWPYTYMEIDRSTTSVFTAGATPQLSIWVTGTWGFSADTDAAGTLAAAVSSTTATAVTVSDGSQMGVGDLLIIDSERMLVQDRATAATGLTQSGTGCSTVSAADVTLATTGTGSLFAGEVILLDSEQMLITDMTNSVATVKRAWNGTVLASHSSAAVYAYRLLTVARGQLGTTAATHSNAAPVSRHRVPSGIRELAIAECVVRVAQMSGGWQAETGEGGSAHPAAGAGLAEKWDEAVTTYGRKGRIRAI
jgi:VCBS repeat-containing protein